MDPCVIIVPIFSSGYVRNCIENVCVPSATCSVESGFENRETYTGFTSSIMRVLGAYWDL